MNIDPNKVKELVLTFAELDEDYQTKLMNRARVLALKQSQEKAIHREGKKFENNLELEKEVEKRSNIKEYLEEVLPKADFNEANKKAMKLLKENKSTHN